MKATLIYNPNSGGAANVAPGRLLEALEEAGYHTLFLPTNDEGDVKDALAAGTGLVVAAGGDGTLREVVAHVLAQPRPLAILPMGTANNVARSLGVVGRPLELARALSKPEPRRFDVGVVTSPWGKNFFLEAMGLGLFAHLLERYAPEQGKSVRRALMTLRAASDYKSERYRIKLDGQEISGTYVAIEAMNTPAMGPRLQLSPDARSDDGLLDIVCVLEPERLRLGDYLLHSLRGSLHSLPNVRLLRATTLEVTWQGEPLHIDAELFPDPGLQKGSERPVIEVGLRPGALELWLPQQPP